MKPQVGSETVGTRWKSGSIGKPGRRQAKTQRKTCEDRTKNSEKKRSQNRAEIDLRAKKNRRKIDQKRPKIDEISVSAAFGRSGSFQVAPESRGNALGTVSDRQVGPSWPPSWPSWLPCWPSWTRSWQPGALQTPLEGLFERVRKLERRSYRFFVVFVTIVESPNLNFRQPVQCFVHFARS